MLTRCLVLSLILHLLIFLAGSQMATRRDGSAAADVVRLRATLKRTVMQEVGVVRAERTVVATPPTHSKKARLQSAAGAERQPAASSEAQSAPVAQEVARTKPVNRSADVGRGDASGEPPHSAEATVTDALSSDGLRQYRLALAREARRYKRYPPYARERAWEGDVVVLLLLAPGEETPAVSLDKPSGYPILDEQALELVRHAARQAALPESLRGRRLRIAVPIQFRLDD